MGKLKTMLPYLAVIILDFYLLPLMIKDTGSAMMMLLVIVPLFCFICSVIFGIKNSFSPFYAVIVAVLFVPTIFIYYNSSAWVYIVGYGVIAFLGNIIGMIFYRKAKGT